MARVGFKILTIPVLLLIHRYRPRGYMLMKTPAHGVFKPGPGRVYSSLLLLRQRGLIKETEVDDGRKRYDSLIKELRY